MSYLGLVATFPIDDVFDTVTSSRQLYVEKITNILLTRKGERPMRPNLGTSIWTHIFAQMPDSEEEASIADGLRRDIEGQIAGLMIDNLTVSPGQDHDLRIHISFRIPLTTEQQLLTINLYD